MARPGAVMARHGMRGRRGEAGHGPGLQARQARPGMARPGLAGRGLAGEARRGRARHGHGRLGERGKARQARGDSQPQQVRNVTSQEQ